MIYLGVGWRAPQRAKRVKNKQQHVGYRGLSYTVQGLPAASLVSPYNNQKVSKHCQTVSGSTMTVATMDPSPKSPKLKI